MSESEVLSPSFMPAASVGDSDAPSATATPAARKRPKPGERREQILQALATMLEKPGAERITTASLAAHLLVSEAALYRHFASKAQMFEGLIDFVEQSVFTLVQQIVGRDVADPDQPSLDGARQAARVIALVLQFGERNPGMARVMVGDALVFEHERLQQRMNQFFDRIESTLRQCLRPVCTGPAAALLALGLSPPAYRTSRAEPRADALML
jgi:TetR/AcrR family transcriptional regulator